MTTNAGNVICEPDSTRCQIGYWMADCEGRNNTCNRRKKNIMLRVLGTDLI